MSSENQESKDKVRGYSPVYEKVIPIAIAVIVVIIAGMLILTLGIALGLIQTG